MADNFTCGETISLTVTSSGTSVSFNLSQSINYPDCMVTNAGNLMAFVGFGGAANLPGAGVQNATPIMPGEGIVLRKGMGTAQCSGITASGSTILYFTAGQGS